MDQEQVELSLLMWDPFMDPRARVAIARFLIREKPFFLRGVTLPAHQNRWWAYKEHAPRTIFKWDDDAIVYWDEVIVYAEDRKRGEEIILWMAPSILKEDLLITSIPF